MYRIVDLLFIFLWQENGEYSLVKKVFSPAEKLYGHLPRRFLVT